MTNILLIDDHVMFLEGLKSLFENEEKIKIAGTAANGEQALELLKTEDINLVITDISMPKIDGIQLVGIIKKQYPSIKSLVLSMHSEPGIISKLVKLEVNGYLLKNAEKEELLKAIESITNGNNFFSEEVKKIYMESSFSGSKNNNYTPPLSKREKEVIKLIMEEYTTKEIAEKLFITQHTVESHRKNILSKLNIKNVAGLAKYAIENGLV